MSTTPIGRARPTSLGWRGQVKRDAAAVAAAAADGPRGVQHNMLNILYIKKSKKKINKSVRLSWKENCTLSLSFRYRDVISYHSGAPPRRSLHSHQHNRYRVWCLFTLFFVFCCFPLAEEDSSFNGSPSNAETAGLARDFPRAGPRNNGSYALFRFTTNSPYRTLLLFTSLLPPVGFVVLTRIFWPGSRTHGHHWLGYIETHWGKRRPSFYERGIITRWRGCLASL